MRCDNLQKNGEQDVFSMLAFQFFGYNQNIPLDIPEKELVLAFSRATPNVLKREAYTNSFEKHIGELP